MNKKKITLLLALIAAASAYGEATVTLDKTIVTSVTGFETEARKTTASPTVITNEEIKEKNYKTVVEALKTVPAVNIITNSFGSMIDLRGQGGLDGNSAGAKANVQVLVDGIAINPIETSMTSSPINTIDIDDVERIEVIPGGGSVIYGSGTSGGVINIITKKGEGLRGGVGYDRTSFDGDKYNVSFGQTIGKFDFDLSYSNNKANGYRDDARDDSEYFEGKVRYNINENHNVEFKFNKYNAFTNILDYLTKEQVEADRKMGDTDGYMSTMKTDKDDYSITYNGKLTENLDVNVIAFHNTTNMLISMPSGGTSTMNHMTLPYTAKTDFDFVDKKEGAKVKAKYSYGDDSSVIFGIDYTNNDGGRYGTVNSLYTYRGMSFLDVNVKTDMDLNKDTIAGFVMNNYKYGNFEFNQGFRYERSDYEVNRSTSTTRVSMVPDMNGSSSSSSAFDKNEDNYAWELSGGYNYSDTGRTYVRYERGFTSPGPSLLTNKYNRTYYLNDLDSQTYNSFEFGVSDFKGFTAINVALFYSLTDDEIYTNMEGSMGSSDSTILNYNIDKTERYGIEVKLEQYLGKLTISESYQYIKAKIKDGTEKEFTSNGSVVDGIDISGNYIAGVPKNKFTLGAKYDFTEKLNVNGEVVYNGSSYIENTNDSGKQEDYIVTNVRVNYNMDNGLTLYAGINNLFDEEYYNAISYSDGEYTYDPAAERNYYVGFKYTF